MKRTLLIAGLLGVLGMFVGSCAEEHPPPGPAPQGFEAPDAVLPRGARPLETLDNEAEGTEQEEEAAE